MRVRSAAVAAAVIALGASGLAACSSSGGGGSNSGTGPFTVVTGKDNSNVWPEIVKRWNAKYPKEKVTVKQQSDQADQQLQDLEQHFQAKDPNYDVVTVDVVWSAEF